MRAALAFLTRIPMGRGLGAGADEGPGAAWFGVVGAVIGGLASLPILALGTLQPWAAAVLLLRSRRWSRARSTSTASPTQPTRSPRPMPIVRISLAGIRGSARPASPPSC